MRPDGPLKAAVDGTGPTWLGTLTLGPELLDARVIGHRPCGDGLLDIDLLAHRQSTDHVASALTVWWPWEQSAGTFRAVDGLDRPIPDDWPPGPPVTLLGCRPTPDLEPGRAFDAELAHLRADGTVHRLDQWKIISGRVLRSEPSAIAPGLVDLTTTARIPSPLTEAERPIWDMWHHGGPSAPGSWVPLTRSGRFLWSRAALIHRRPVPDRPADTVYHLDGRHITDYDAFFCAIGEAINGPGGWFGSGLFWLHDCSTGGAGATHGFHLIWHDADVARTHLAPGYDPRTHDAAVTFTDLVESLTIDGVRLELR